MGTTRGGPAGDTTTAMCCKSSTKSSGVRSAWLSRAEKLLRDGTSSKLAGSTSLVQNPHSRAFAPLSLTGLTGSLNLNFNYDVQGNITSRGMGNSAQGFVFDIANRMTRADNVPGAGTVQYAYDGNGPRAWANDANGTHRGSACGQDGKLQIVGETCQRPACRPVLGSLGANDVKDRGNETMTGTLLEEPPAGQLRNAYDHHPHHPHPRQRQRRHRAPAVVGWHGGG